MFLQPYDNDWKLQKSLKVGLLQPSFVNYICIKNKTENNQLPILIKEQLPFSIFDTPAD